VAHGVPEYISEHITRPLLSLFRSTNAEHVLASKDQGATETQQALRSLPQPIVERLAKRSLTSLRNFRDHVQVMLPYSDGSRIEYVP